MVPQHSAAVYRRRRLSVVIAVILIALLVAAGVWMLVAKPWTSGAGEPSPTSTTTPGPTAPLDDSESPSPEPSGEETPPGIVACEEADIVVTAVTDAESYPAGVLPQLSISLTNNGAADCTMNVGSSTQMLTVTSGADVWWRSTDCQENPSDMIATLKAGETVTSAVPVTWDRTRSSVQTCADENRPRASGGGASYHVAVSIGGFDSVGTRQIFLQ